MVYIFKRNVATAKYELSGNLTATSIPPDQRSTSLFGWSLAFSKKKVCLIRQCLREIIHELRLILSGLPIYCLFILSILLVQNVIFVGARQAFGRGAVLVFRQMSENDENAPWAYVNNIIESHPTTNFGWAVDLDEESINNTLIVGAPSSGGAAFIYKEVSKNKWTRFQIVSPADGEEFGYSVAVENSIALIGAKNSTLGTRLMAGTAYIYNIPIGSNGTAILTQRLQAPTPRSNASFGYSVALGDGRMVVGELNREGDGSVYLYCKNITDGWEGVLPPITPENKTHSGEPNFGTSVAGNSIALLVGSPLSKVSGSVYAYSVGGCT